MKSKDIERLRIIEERTREIFEEEGLKTCKILFEVVSSRRVIEAMAYGFPTNFSHWTHGRDFDQIRTRYEHIGAGIPYEVVWNFGTPRAFLVETNPFGLNAAIIPHVFAHVDFFLSNKYLKTSRDFIEMASEARQAERRFRRYTEREGRDEVERYQDAALSIRWHQHPDPSFKGADEEEIRRRLIEIEKSKLTAKPHLLGSSLSREERLAIEKTIRALETKTPPMPEYDLLGYIIRHSPKPLKDWQYDILEVIRSQARFLIPNARTKMLNEGWATYWHSKIMLRLLKEKLITTDEYGVYESHHKDVVRQSKASMNWYRVGQQLFLYIEDRWNKGRFGKEYDECRDPRKLANWDTGAGMGDKHIRFVRANYYDRMAIEEFFTDEFIRHEELYVYERVVDPLTGEVIYVVVEDDPKVIRPALVNSHTLYGIPTVRVENGNYGGRNELYLVHETDEIELDTPYRQGAMEAIYYLWGRPVYLESIKYDESGKKMRVVFVFDGRNHAVVKQKE